MTANEFSALCSEYGIHPSVALENDDIVEALKNRDTEAVADILANEF